MVSSVKDCERHVSALAADLGNPEGRIFAIEEPLAVGDINGCLRAGDRLGLRIILAESCKRSEDLDAVAASSLAAKSAKPAFLPERCRR